MRSSDEPAMFLRPLLRDYKNNGRILLANLLQSSMSTFSWRSFLITGCKFLQSVQRIEMTAGNVYRGGEPPARAHEQNTEGSCALHHPCCPSRLPFFLPGPPWFPGLRSEEHTSELQSRLHLV